MSAITFGHDVCNATSLWEYLDDSVCYGIVTNNYYILMMYYCNIIISPISLLLEWWLREASDVWLYTTTAFMPRS